MSQLEQSFADICAKHDLTSFSVSHTVDPYLTQWSANGHWEGHTNSGHNCAFGYGDTIAEAVAKLLATIAKDRAGAIVGLADEPLQIGEAA